MEFAQVFSPCRTGPSVNRLSKTLILALSSVIVIACGGGGGSNFSPEIASGQFKDSNVEGLSFVSGDQSGVTDALGTFSYEVGNTVTFSVGNVVLGTAEGAAIITPIDLVPDGSISDERVLNIVSFLLALDDDRDGDNGIRISAVANSLADNWPDLNLSLLDVAADDFLTQPFAEELVPLISELASSLRDGATFLNLDEITRHFQSTLSCAKSGIYRGRFSGDDSGNFAFILDSLFGIAPGYVWSDTIEEQRIAAIFELSDALGPYRIELADFDVFESPTIAMRVPLSFELFPRDLLALPNPIALVAVREFMASDISQSVVSGTWQQDTLSGTFTGERLGGDLDAIYRVSARYLSGPDALLLAIDLDDNGNASGFAYSVMTDVVTGLSGQWADDQLTITLESGEELQATINVELGYIDFGLDAVFSPSPLALGGSVCKLN